VADAQAPAARSVGADAEAERRVAAVLGGLEHLDLNVVVLPYPDEEVVSAVERARDAAFVAGRRHLLASATESAREIAIRGFARSAFSGTWAASEMAASVARPEDRVAAAAAFEAAATAAVAADLVDDDTIELLRGPTESLRSTTGLSQPGALSNFASPGVRGATDAVPVGLGIAVVIAGILVIFVFGTLASGLIVIALGLLALGAIGKRWRAR
jgi:hypothetical protein